MLKNYQTIFLYLLILSYILYVLVFIGIVNNSPSYLETLNFVLKIYVSLVLLIRFNPFINRAFTEFDKKIVFSCALFLISTTTINEIAINYKRIKGYIKNYTN